MEYQSSMKAVFFDRDGVVNKDFGYVYQQKDFEFVAGIFELLQYCKQKGFLLIIVTNQSGIGRGYYSIEDFKSITSYMQQELKKTLKFGFDSIYFCPHHPESDCQCRKPKISMIEQAKKDYHLDLSQCFIIGDKISDVQAGQNAGIKHKILVGKQAGSTIQGLDHLHIVTQISEVREVMERILTT